MLERGRRASDMPDLDTLFAPLAGFKRIGIAVSGGPDSLALMVLAHNWVCQTQKDVSLTVYTVDHGLRPEAADEAAFVARAAKLFGLSPRVLRWEDVKPSTGLQDAARSARYGLIAQAMAQDKTEVLLTAHHADDQAETVLMRMGHGSGVSGLGGMRQMSHSFGIDICRPLLGLTPDSLTEVLREAGITPIIDPSNKNVDFERVRWRQLLPTLDGLGLDSARFALFAQRMQRAEDALVHQVSVAQDRLTSVDRFGAVEIDLPALRQEPEEVQIRVLQAVLNGVGCGRKPFALQQVEALCNGLVGPGKFTQKSLFGCLISRRENSIWVVREVSRVTEQKLILAPGEVGVWDQRFEITNNHHDIVHVGRSNHFVRADLEAVLPMPLSAPLTHIHGAPEVHLVRGGLLALGLETFDSAINVKFVGLNAK